ncbi:uncharacterized protein LOC133179906 [Saccostrea echinata]|uniref:uncharacterized protein LOC133179906 n=1 Tax=Saccostrea echinata TaxID=191078 RepID=UPI002A7FA4E6|nr:uncharacterized protein LOC133179906 [Saccostrea echinata]
MSDVSVSAELAKIHMKYADEETALKKAQAEIIYKQQLIKMDLELLAEKRAIEEMYAKDSISLEDLTDVSSWCSSEYKPISVKAQEENIQSVQLSAETPAFVPRHMEPHAPKRIRDGLTFHPAQPVVTDPSARELFPGRPKVTSSTYIPLRANTRDNRLNDTHRAPCLPEQGWKDSVHSWDFSPEPTSAFDRDLLPPEVDHIPPIGTRPVDQCSDFAKFLLKKDLVLTRLSKFDDRPENYLAWKHSFKSVMKELDISASEELDLLVKFLGPSSTPQAISVRSSNPLDHQRGLFRIWSRLDERYGSPQVIEAALKRKLEIFAKISVREKEKLYVLSDILSEIESAMEDPQLRDLLSYFNTSSGTTPIVAKLPPSLQSKWRDRAVKYKNRHNVAFPPFRELSEFIREQSTIWNDPGFVFACNPQPVQTGNRGLSVNNRKTAVGDSNNSVRSKCPIHNADHSLQDCKGFLKLSMTERKKFLRDRNLCFKCCASTDHRAKDCTVPVKCRVCSSDKHTTALHVGVAHRTQSNLEPRVSVAAELHGGEPQTSLCTEVCGPGFSGKSCGKAVLVRIYSTDTPQNYYHTYALIDDQSNRTLARSKLFDALCSPKTESVQYTLSTCAGRSSVTGRQMSGLTIESLDKTFRIGLPPVIECNNIPNDRQEIPTPDVITHFEHLKGIQIPPLDEKANILLLIGRDLPEVHHVLEQKTGPRTAPFAQRLPLGWVVIGNVCLGDTCTPSTVASVNKTTILSSGRPSAFEPCDHHLAVSINTVKSDGIGQDVFIRTTDDEKDGYSVEDRQFLEIMGKEFKKTPDGHWEAPLPFKESRSPLPNNREEALKRARILQKNLQRDPVKRDHFRTFMTKLLHNGHAEVAPPLDTEQECWYLPLFGVYHPRKRDQVRVVFDSSANYKGISLNAVLMSGPVLMNSLVGVLHHFRKEPVAVMADIQQMFYGFFVTENHRDFLRFFWHQDHDPQKDLVEYRMCVHVFGNSPSPAVATYGLRRCVAQSEDPEVREFVNNQFYVDDGLASFPTEEEAIKVLRNTQETLYQEGQLKLHKIASNSKTVMNNFCMEDLASDLKTLDIAKADLPLQHSLGLVWDLNLDTFTYRVRDDDKPFTRRGVLSVVNSLFDPLGMIAPVVLLGRILMRDLIAETTDWDIPLPECRIKDWRNWKDSLKSLEHLQVPRCLLQHPYKDCVLKRLHVFSDASEQAIAAVAFLQAIDSNGAIHIGFTYGKSKIAPKHGHTIPRLELCAAVLAVEVGEMVSQHLGLELSDIQYYSDSRVVLGYLQNTSRRFYIYVSNRVARIHRSSQPDQWNYIRSEINPADSGTRIMLACQLQESSWLKGPDFLYTETESHLSEGFHLVNPESDREIRPEVTSCKTKADGKETVDYLGTSRFKRFSSWKSLLSAIRVLLRFLTKFRNKNKDTETNETEFIKQAENQIVRAVQRDMYPRETEALMEGRPIPRTSSILKLAPFIDDQVIIRVGGRLQTSDLPYGEKHPVLIPGKHHVATLIVRRFHEQTEHQGRHLTEGAVRKTGFWITGGKRLSCSLRTH